MCKEFNCECCSDEIPGDTCTCTDCYHGDEAVGNGQCVLVTPALPPKSCCNTSVPNKESKYNSGSCCGGSPSAPSEPGGDIDKCKLPVAAVPKKCCKTREAQSRPNAPAASNDGCPSTAEMEQISNGRPCYSSQKPDEDASVYANSVNSSNSSTSCSGSDSCCSSKKKQNSNVSVDDQVESSDKLHESLPSSNPGKSCCSSKQNRCCKSKNLTEKQEQTSPNCKSRDMPSSTRTDKPRCSKRTYTSCIGGKSDTAKKIEGQAVPSCCGSSARGASSCDSTKSCCSSKGSIGSVNGKNASEISPNSRRNQVPCCKPKDTEDLDLNIVKTPCCNNKVGDVCSADKKSDNSSKQQPGSENSELVLSSCCDSRKLKENLLEDKSTKPWCRNDTCRPNCLQTADRDSKSETNEGKLEDLCCKEARKVKSCCCGRGAYEEMSPCSVNISKECNRGPPRFVRSMVCSCCEEKESVQSKKRASYCQDACCKSVEQPEDSCQSANSTPNCDDANGCCCSSASTCGWKPTFTISSSTLSLESPSKPTPENDDRDDVPLLPKKCTTKLRVQNICCIMEANLVRECLEPMESVFSVAVNVIGRVAHVQHNPQVTTPTDLVKCLNKVHLGASIMETGSRHDSDKGEKIPKSLKLHGLYLLLNTVLFVTAVVGYVLKEEWFQWVAVAEIVFGILPVIKKAYTAIKTCTVDIGVLMLIAIVGTIAIQDWVEGAAVVFVFAFAEGLQDLCMYKVQQTISGLMLKAPRVAVIAKSGECVPIEDVAIGTIIAVRPGELVVLDGVVVSGRAAVDESSISGEAVPVEKSVDSVVYSGTVNQNGYIEVRTTSDSSSSTVSKVSQMVQEAQASSATTEILINRFAKYYTPVVIVISALIVVVPAILGASGVGTYLKDISEWGRRALVMLVIACPCALVMSTPIAIVCGITAAARKGVLVKGGAFMETLARLKTLAFDKTGTLTEGKFQVEDIVCEFGVNERENLRLAAALESKSSHPLAAAIVNEFSGCVAEMVKSQGTDLLPEVTHFKLHEGQGVSGIAEGKLIEVGNHEFLDRTDSSLNSHMMDKYHQWGGESKTVVFVCIDSKLAMMIALADSIRPNAMQALDWLQHLGVQTSMITGDNSRAAAAVKDKLGLDECVSEMKPKDKLYWIQHRQTQGKCNGDDQRGCCARQRKTPPQRIVGMVGDGINDGPALAAADVGIAMGAGGTALAVEAADVALMSNNLAKIPELVSLGRFCRRVVIQNISFSVVLKLAVVTAAILGKAAVWTAVCADVLGLLFVILNGLRPLWWNSSRFNNKGDANIDLSFAKSERAQYTHETCV